MFDKLFFYNISSSNIAKDPLHAEEIKEMVTSRFGWLNRKIKKYTIKNSPYNKINWIKLMFMYSSSKSLVLPKHVLKFYM